MLKGRVFDFLTKSRQTILYVENLSVYKPDKTPIVENVSFDLNEGEILGVIGESGSGKSTVIKTIINQQNLPLKGNIRIAGYDIFHDQKIVSKLFGYVPQELGEVYATLTPTENIAIFGRQYGMSEVAIKNKANELFEKLDIGPEQQLLHVEKLSGGEQRRVSIAAGMIHSPKLVILDEPTSGLDPIMRHATWGYIQRLNILYHTTFVVITQFPKEAKYCDKIAVFVKGLGFTDFGTPSEILAKLPNNGFVVDVTLELFSEEAKNRLKQIPSVRYILQIGEKLRIFADMGARECVTQVVMALQNQYAIHKIEAKRQADMADYINILATNRK
jgi:ABC-2 type transport system ATP-binding protein